tara:strand:+ start:3605 stop:3796 length:192 start_codon:yes stop_codon:yes gene_type:complete
MNVRDIVSLVLIALAIGTIYPLLKDQISKVLGKKRATISIFVAILGTLVSLKYLSQFANDALN